MSDELKKVFASNLNRLLDYNGLTQKEFAESINEKQQTINSWCTGNAIPRMGRIQKIADFFQIKKTDLLEKLDEDDLGSLEDKQVLDSFHKLNERGKTQFKIQLENLLCIPAYLKSGNELYLAAASGTEGMDGDELDAVQQEIEKIKYEDD